MTAFDVKAFFTRLVEGIREGNLVQLIPKENVMHLLHEARKVFLSQPMLLKINGPVIVCGDLHGQFCDIMRIFESEGFPHVRNYLFLGDYVDRGHHQIELILFMFACKIRYPNNFFMLRGNHETQNINNAYGFHDAVLKFYEDEEMYKSFQRTFELMPLAALISSRILCMHGGLSPPMLDAPNLEIINNIVRPLEDNQITQDKNQLAVDLLWADPDVNVRFFGRNPRGAGCTFGQEVINQVLRRFKLDLIIRAHQVVQDGYEFFGGNPNSGLLTLFTAPHYCGLYDNAGAIVKVSGDLGISTKVFQPAGFQQANKRNGTS